MSILRRSLLMQKVTNTNEDCNDDDAERSSLVASERAAVATSTPHSSPHRISDLSSSLHQEHFQGCLKLYAENDCNDDDAESSSLVASERAAVATSTPHSSPHRISDLSSPLHQEHFQGCLKLYAENKINKYNAWNLQLIDIMASMLRRNDPRIENLQTASTLVDASARIYSFRVDAVHYDVLKMAGALCKAAQTKRGKKDHDMGTQEEGAVDNENAAPAKKKKRSKGSIARNPEVLNGDFDTNPCIDPFFERLAATTGDITSSNRAFNATLPIHNKTLALILRTDEKYLQPRKENIPELDLTERITLPRRLLPAFTEADRICEPFHKFSISNWDPETEDTDNRINDWVEETLNLSHQALVFDVHADVEPVPPDDQHNDLYDEEPLGGIESEEEADEGVAACVARLSAPDACVPRLTDMRPGAAHDSRLEYSYCGAIVGAWAGPAHWRLKNNKASKMPVRTHSRGGAMVECKRPARTKRQLDFMGPEALAFDWRACGSDFEPAPPAKITISRRTLATGRTWNEANYKMPVDRGLDESHFRKLFLRPDVLLKRQRALDRSQPHHAPAADPAPPPAPAASPAQLTLDQPADYDYNNENASYCPAAAADGDEWGPEGAAAAADIGDHMAVSDVGIGDMLEPPTKDGDEWGPEGAAAAADIGDHMAVSDVGIGDMLEPPTKVAKIFIPYAMRAKKVDMKQLKHCTWKILMQHTVDSREDKEEITPMTFSEVYRRLHATQSAAMRDSISVPLVLLSVLHLCNEKGLVLEQRDDLKDFDILGLNTNGPRE